MAESRRFWRRALAASIAGTVVLVAAVWFIPYAGISQVSKCVDFAEGSGQQSYCEDSTYVGPGIWIVLAVGVVAIVVSAIRLTRSRAVPRTGGL